MQHEFLPDPGPRCPDVVRIVVEIPKLSTNKYEYDQELKLFKLTRTLYSPMHYPGDYGFVPGTTAEDDDPLDVLVLVAQPSFPGCLYDVRAVGVLDMVDEDEPDHKILAVPMRDPRGASIQNLADVSPHILREIEHFFSIYKELEEKTSRMDGWRNAQSARATIEESRARFLNLGVAAPGTFVDG